MTAEGTCAMKFKPAKSLVLVLTVILSLCHSAALASGTKPPVIIIKVDDLKTGKSPSVPDRWQKFADYVRARRLKVGIGIICDSLEGDKPEYFNWIRALNSTGLVEFWFHGYDHKVHNDDGTDYNEFNHRTLQDQKNRFERSEGLATQKLGIRLQTFGPGGGTRNGLFDENTVTVMGQDPQMSIWLYPQPLDDQGRALQSHSKVIILDRVWQANIENPTFHPNLAALQNGYRQFAASRDYLVLQGHPGTWDDQRFSEFTQIIDFLAAQGCTFMTPSEYCRSALAKR